MTLQRICCVVRAFAFKVSGVGFFLRVKSSEVYAALVDKDPRGKLISNAADANVVSIWPNSFVGVLRVAGPRYLAQIRPSVIVAHAVDVVNLVLWKTTCHVQPRKPMVTVLDTIYPSDKVPVGVVGAARFSHINTVGCAKFAEKLPGIRGVLNNLSEPVRRKIGCNGSARCDVFQPRIKAVAVSRNQLAGGPYAVTDKPCDLRRGYGDPKNHYCRNGFGFWAMGNFASANARPGMRPAQNSGLGFVLKFLADLFRGKIALAHSVLRIAVSGKKPVEVGASVGFRYFNGMC